MVLRRDSRLVDPGDVFIACAADATARAAHIREARARGATRILSSGGEPDCEWVADARWTFARLHAQAIGLDRCPPVIGVTGTDGKTTCVHFLHQLLGPGAARIGTLGFHDGQQARSGTHTTPDAEALNQFVADLDPACPGIAIELSSHGLDQGRAAALPLSVLIWTGLGSDHLDYHGDLDSYFAAKCKALMQLNDAGLLIIRAEDARREALSVAAAARGARVISLGFTTGTVRVTRAGPAWHLESPHCRTIFQVPMTGAINAWNAAAALLAAQAVGVSMEDACARLAVAEPPPGRLERVHPERLCYVDYAHTPVALEEVLISLRDEHPQRRLVVVFGCGGERDQGKRARMGAIARRLADRVIITTDNARSEDPRAIAQAIAAGAPVHPDAAACPLIELDRAQAIAHGLREAGPEGVLLVAGKGHEQVQIIGAQRLPWDDVAACRHAIAEEEVGHA